MSRSDVPLLTEVVPGFRAWVLSDEGTLRPAAVGHDPWAPGVNVARCAAGGGHEPPAGSCTCGLYAFHTQHRQLGGEPVIGGIAAWGAMEVHRDGFRAERAMVLALADGRGTRDRHAALQRAAERYQVPIVDRSVLQPVVSLMTAALPPSVVALDPQQHDTFIARRRGFDADAQLWVEPSQGVVAVGASRHLRAWLGNGDIAITPRERVIEIEGGGIKIYVPRAIRGEIVAVNQDLAAAPWLLRVRPTHWDADCRPFDWGEVGATAMEARALREGRQTIAHLLEPDAPGSWREVLAEMRARRAIAAAPRFATAQDLYDDLAIPLGQALARDRAVRQRLTRLETVLTLGVTDLGARITLDLRSGRGVLFCGDRGPRPDVEVGLCADDLVLILKARLDLAQAAKSQRVGVRGDLARALSVLAIVGRFADQHMSDMVPA